MSFSFVVFQKPYSYNSQSTRKKNKMRAEFSFELQKKYKSLKILENNLYGLVYYIRPQVNTLDADNISKPIWDALTGVTYDDDRKIVHRRATIIEADDFSTLSIDSITSTDLKRILKAVEKGLDVIYIEMGIYNPKLIEFNLEGKK